jgi:hypothetical protein
VIEDEMHKAHDLPQDVIGRCTAALFQLVDNFEVFFAEEKVQVKDRHFRFCYVFMLHLLILSYLILFTRLLMIRKITITILRPLFRK